MLVDSEVLLTVLQMTKHHHHHQVDTDIHLTEKTDIPAGAVVVILVADGIELTTLLTAVTVIEYTLSSSTGVSELLDKLYVLTLPTFTEPCIIRLTPSLEHSLIL